MCITMLTQWLHIATIRVSINERYIMSDLDTIAINDMKHDLCEITDTRTQCRECFIKNRGLCEMPFDSWEMANKFADTLKANRFQFEGFKVRNVEHLDGTEHGVYFVEFWQ